MRRLMITALSALILLCVSSSTPQGRGLHSIRWPPLMIDLLIRAGAPAAASPRPVAPHAQAPASERGATPSAQESVSLEPGNPVERELSGGQSHFYKIAMTSGQYLQVAVSPQGIDVLVALFTPDGKRIGEADIEQATLKSDTISTIAEATGAYRIEVRSVEKIGDAGRYEIKLEELREATAEDKHRIAAESVFREAAWLIDGTLEDKRKSAEKYHEALALYRRAGDRRGEAETLSNIGEVYYLLGEMQKALEKYNEALPLRRDVGDRNGEADTLLGIARVEQKRGNLTQARQTVEQAVGIIESLRTNIASQELRASYFASQQKYYESYIDILMEQHKQNPVSEFGAIALAISERARARSLLELLKESRADRNVSITLRHLGEKFRLQEEAQRPFPTAAAGG